MELINLNLPNTLGECRWVVIWTNSYSGPRSGLKIKTKLKAPDWTELHFNLTDDIFLLMLDASNKR